MSTKAVIVALIIALVLGVGAYLVLQPGPGPVSKPDVLAAGERVCAIDPGSVSWIEIESHDGERQTIRRADPSGFVLTISRESGKEGPDWPLEEGRVTNLLRVLSGARSLDAPDEKAEMDGQASRVTIREEGGRTIHLLLSGRTLTGRGLVKVVEDPGTLGLAELRERGGKLAVVDDAIHNVFRQPGPRGWRDTVVMQGMGPDVSRLHMGNYDLKLKLARLEGKWVLQEPVAAPADPARVGALIGTLSNLRISSFGDDSGATVPGEEVTGLTEPLATIVSETDRRVLGTGPNDADVSVRTESAEVIIGKPADATGQTRYARLGKDGPVVVISSAGLVRELFDPVEYISRRAVQAPAMDIGMLVLEPAAADTAGTDGTAPAPAGKVYRRDLEKWKEVSGAAEVTLDDTMTKGVGDVLRFLTAEDAVAVALQPPAVWKEEGQLLVGSLAGTPLETVVIGATDGANLGIRTAGADGKGVVYRWYPREKVPGMLRTLLPAPTEAVKPPEGAAEKDVVK